MAERRPLRLLVAGISWPPETFLEGLIRGLATAELDVTIAVGRRPDPESFSAAGLHFLRTAAWNGSIPLRAARLAALWCRAMILARHEVRLISPHVRRASGWVSRLRTWYLLLPFVGRRWDVIYFPWNSGAVAHLPLFELGRPAVLSCRGSQISIAPHARRRVAAREKLQSTFQKAAAVHCVSHAIRKEAMRFGLDPMKSHVIHPGVDPEVFRPSERREPGPGLLRVVTIGSLGWVKGYEYAFQAIRCSIDVGVPICFGVGGDGAERQRMLYTIHDLRLEDHVHLLGRLTPEEVRAHLQQADVFLLSSLSEGLSNAVLEAMACGLPVVTTACGGMPEAVTDGVEGFVVPLRDPEAMAKALSTLASDAELRRRMGWAGRERVLKHFNLRRQIDEFVAMIDGVARC
ncbi:MAG: glycosyltransferase family 4 protein, partial [Candidatus Methylomirabilis sp.]